MNRFASFAMFFGCSLSLVLADETDLSDSSDAGSEKRVPNVVFILVDDLGYMDIGANNPDTFYETPQIDRLASSGMRFTQGYAANPVCSPTRYSIMTGRFPSRIDATNFFAGKRSGTFLPAPLNDRMPLEETTIAELLKTAGHTTFFAGKWHLGPDEDFWPTKQGFDVNRGGHAAGGPFKAGKYFSPYANPRLHDGPEGEHLTARLAEETVNFIRAHREQPFLAYLSFYSVHTPLMAPKPLVEKYRAKAERLGLLNADAFGDEEQVWTNAKPRRVRQLQAHATYAAMVESMDAAVGRVLTTLDDLGLSDDTIVCLTSDNGGLSTSEGSPTSNLPLRGGKGWLYEGGIREAFLVRAPGITQPGSVCETPVMSIDFYPTLAELLKIEIDATQDVDGKSLVPLLRGGADLDRSSLYWHYPHYSNQGGFPGGAIRTDDWKLVERYEDGRRHLYDLNSDIGETSDVASEHPERVKQMTADLHDWYQRVDAKFLRPKPMGPEPWSPSPENSPQ
ncbi:MAG: sulfatase [Rubripirellula sp.]